MADTGTADRTPARLAAGPRPRGNAPQTGTLRIGLLVGGLVVALIAGFALGKATSTTSGTGTPAGGATPTFNEASPHVHPATGTTGGEIGGLAISAAGYTLVPQQTAVKAGAQDFRFVITGPNRKPVTTFAVVHEKPLHLVVVRRDMSGYQHLHPTMTPDGTWSVKVDLSTGMWRAIADFTAIDSAGAQTAVALGTDLTVAGAYQPVAVPQPARTATVGDYTVTFEGTPQIGATSPILFRVLANGSPATLQPYLGSYGHLVVFRDLDLAYVHTHPDAQLSNGGVKFWATAPSSGTYRMFFDFQVDGKVHTAAFTLVV